MENKRKILVAVTGMSPQIVTETVYALHAQQNWQPDEIHVLTTQIGYDNITKALLGENGFFGRLCQEYELSAIQFDEQNIHVICDAEGKKLADIRTPEENNLAADMIVNFIRKLCADENTELHVSIAGGRKSMGFYIGYALSLFGRPQDKLSHVLVEEAFEQNREFFYPPKTKTTLNTDRYGMKDAAQAQVMLAEIPFVRMSYGIPNLTHDNVNYSSAVQLLQNSLQSNNIILNVKECTIQIGSSSPVKIKEKRFFCTYVTLAELHKQGRNVQLKNQATCYDNIKNNIWQTGIYPELDEFQELYWNNMMVMDGSLRTCADRSNKRELANIAALQNLRELPSRFKKILSKHFHEYLAVQYGAFSTNTRTTPPTFHLKVPAELIEIVKE